MRWRRSPAAGKAHKQASEGKPQSPQDAGAAALSPEDPQVVAGACTRKMVTDTLEFGAEVIIYMVAVTLLVTNFPSLLVLWMICAAAALANILRANRRRFVSTARTLVDTESSKAVGALAEWLGTSWSDSMRAETIRAMIRFLPRMEAKDAKTLTPKQRNYLRSLLFAETPQRVNGSGRTNATSADRRALKLAILNSFRKIGDELDLRCVERLAQSLSTEPSDAHLRSEALECLEVMNARLAVGRGRDTLLRASSGSTVSGRELLRGAADAGETPAELLLRGSDGEEQEPVHREGAFPPPPG